MTIAEVGAIRGRNTWTAEDQILFSTGNRKDGGLMRVQASGGRAEVFVERSERARRYPGMIGDVVMYTDNASGGNWDDANLVVARPGDPPRIVVRGGYLGRYLSSGHLLYMRERTVLAAPFDIQRLETTATAVPVAEGVADDSYSVSRTGVLAYVAGSTETDAPLFLMDRSGQMQPLRTMQANWNHPKFSPDGRRLAIALESSGNRDIWILDVATGSLTRATSDPAPEDNPSWTYVQSFPGGGETWRLSNNDNAVEPIWSRAGRELVYRARSTRLMTVPYSVDKGIFKPEAARPWSPVGFAARPLGNPIDVHPDGNRIVMAPLEPTAQNHIALIFNLFDELQRLAPSTAR